MACEAPDLIVVIDVETTGMTPARGARITEVGAVAATRDGRIADTFQSLVNAGVAVPPFIENLTGISTAMLRDAPPPGDVLARLARFVGRRPMLAHNAAFDGRFLDAELARLGRRRRRPMLCSLRLARRVYPALPGYGLGALVRELGLPHDNVFHRALADATATAQLWAHLCAELRERYGVDAPLTLLRELESVPKRAAADFLRRRAVPL